MPPIKLPLGPEVTKRATDASWRITQDSIKSGMTTQAGGDRLRHLQGIEAEILFKDWLRSKGIRIHHCPLRKDYQELSEFDDFVVEGPKARATIELKSSVSMDDLGQPLYPHVLFPLHQLIACLNEEGIHHFDFAVFLGMSTSRTRAWLLGWSTPQELNACERVKEGVKLPAVKVPLTKLKPMYLMLRRLGQ
jgi:hypothetical protein